jgi:hypothetical protein
VAKGHEAAWLGAGFISHLHHLISRAQLVNSSGTQAPHLYFFIFFGSTGV